MKLFLAIAAAAIIPAVAGCATSGTTTGVTTLSSTAVSPFASFTQNRRYSICDQITSTACGNGPGFQDNGQGPDQGN